MINELFYDRQKFGRLAYHAIYSFYDEPLIFSTLNECGVPYFCYSLGLNMGQDRWIVVETSTEWIDKLETRQIPIAELLSDQIAGTHYIVTFNSQTGEIHEHEDKGGRFNYELPGKDVYVDEVIRRYNIVLSTA